jgi:hypothetical protein
MSLFGKNEELARYPWLKRGIERGLVNTGDIVRYGSLS